MEDATPIPLGGSSHPGLERVCVQKAAFYEAKRPL